MLSLMLFLVMMEVFSKMMKRVKGVGLLRGFRVDGRRGGGVCVLHLLDRRASCRERVSSPV